MIFRTGPIRLTRSDQGGPCFLSSDYVPNGPKWPQHGQKWPKVVAKMQRTQPLVGESDPKWPKVRNINVAKSN